MEKALTIYDGVNEEVLSFVPTTAIRILDVGCGTGVMGEHLCLNRDRLIVGITYSEREADLASRRLSKVYCADLNVFDFGQLGTAYRETDPAALARSRFQYHRRLGPRRHRQGRVRRRC